MYTFLESHGEGTTHNFICFPLSVHGILIVSDMVKEINKTILLSIR